MDASTSTRATRVCILQQIVPHYRVPVFDLLARQPGIELSVWADMHSASGSLKPAKGTGAYKEGHARIRKVGPLLWQPGQVEAAKRGGFDVIIYSWNSRLAHLGRALRACRRRSIPTLLWGHGLSKQESPMRRTLRNRLLNLANGCILYNNAAAEMLVREGFARQRIFIALNAIDQTPVKAAIEHWRARPQELAAFKSKHGIGDECLLFVSRLEPEKRVDMLLETFARVQRERPKAQLAIIGRGPEEARLREHAATLGISNAVIFAGAIYQEMELAPWFLSAVCMPYTVNLGLSLLHAFGYGLPVITSDDATLHGPEIEALRDEHNGLLYRLGDIEQFTAQVLRCLADCDLRQRLSQNARATVQPPDGFCVQRMVSGFMDAIEFARTAPAK